MAYMRGPLYVWSDGHRMHVWLQLDEKDGEYRYIDWPRDCGWQSGVGVPMKDFDALVAMRWAQMEDAERTKAQAHAVRNWKGNIDCQSLVEAMGYETLLDFWDRTDCAAKGEKYRLRRARPKARTAIATARTKPLKASTGRRGPKASLKGGKA